MFLCRASATWLAASAYEHGDEGLGLVLGSTITPYRINTLDSRFAYSRTLHKGAPDLHKNTAIHARAKPK